MPNHVENDLYIRGPKDQIDAALALIGAVGDSPKFDFNALIPYPENFRQMDEDARTLKHDAYLAKYGHNRNGFNSGGYEWCNENWGTKWGAYDVAQRDYQGTCITFQTAWAPSQQIVVALAKRFPALTLSLEYFERGQEFCGGLTCNSEDDHYGDEPWEAGAISNEWHSKEYRGLRGG